MKKLIILSILLCFPALIFGADLLVEKVGIEPIAKPSISDRIAVKEALIDKTQTETIQAEEMAVIVDEETTAFAEQINKTFLSVSVSEELKDNLRATKVKQYPVLEFPFLNITSDDPEIFYIDAERWTNLKVVQDEIRDGTFKLITVGVTKKGGSIWSNWKPANETLTTKQLKSRAKEFEIIYQAVKLVRPDVPVAFVAVQFPNLQEWLNAFTIQPDAWLLMNVDNYGANWTKIKHIWFANKPVIANINYGFVFNEGVEQIYDTKFGDILKKIGYAGKIYWRKE